MQYRISAASETTTLISTPITTATTTLVTNSTGADSTVTEMVSDCLDWVFGENLKGYFWKRFWKSGKFDD